MSPMTACPDQGTLRRLMLGKLPGSETAQLAWHLEQCDDCVSAARMLQVDDTLVQAARGPTTRLDRLEKEVVGKMIERLRRLGPPSTDARSQTGVIEPVAETRVQG